MDKTILVGSQGINGNIGSCEIKSDTFSVSSFYNQTIAVNSCTGEIMTNVIYYDWGYLYFPLSVVIIVGIVMWISS